MIMTFYLDKSIVMRSKSIKQHYATNTHPPLPNHKELEVSPRAWKQMMQEHQKKKQL